MNDDQLKRLLCEADTDAGRPPVAEGLARRVRWVARRRQRRVGTMGAVGGIAVVVVLGVALAVTRPGGVDQVDAVATVAAEGGDVVVVDGEGGAVVDGQGGAVVDGVSGQAVSRRRSQREMVRLRTELAQLRRELDARTKIIERLQEREKQRARLTKARRRLVQLPNALEEVREEAERAALTIVYTADHKYNELNLKESAIADYHRAVELFPKTKWAGIARERLSKIEPKIEGESL